MIRGDDFIKALGLPDEGFYTAMDAALRQVRESEGKPIMKKKITFTILMAAAFVLALTGAALAVGFNLFDYFGEFDHRLQVIAPETTIETDAPLVADTEALGTVTARIDSAYYDGQSLIVAYTLENFRRFEPFTPTPEALKAMELSDELYPDLSEATEDQLEIARSYRDAAEAGRPYGLIEYAIAPMDNCYTPDGVELYPSTCGMEVGKDGKLNAILEFETPLPKDAQNRDALILRMPIQLYTSWFYFDGQKHYAKYAHEDLGDMTATARRAEAVTRTYAWEGMLNGVKARAEARISAVHGRLRIEAGDGALPDPVSLWPEVANADDTWYSFDLTDGEGKDYRFSRFSGGMEGEGVMELEFDGLGYLPDKIELTICLDGEGDWDADAHALPGCPVTLTPR